MKLLWIELRLTKLSPQFRRHSSKKIWQPVIREHSYIFLKSNKAKEAPEVESIIEETAQTDDKRTHQNQEELDIKKNSEHKVVQNPVTPGPTAMKVLFAEETKVFYEYEHFLIF